MCGIVTIFNYNSNEPVDRAELLRIRDHMIKRGPDGSGEWFSKDSRVGMGHRRLAIIDLSETGSQPMCNEDGTIWITYNGEIYNYKELGDRLRAKGHRFRSTSDTEVIIHGYEEWGIEELLKQLRGMFAFALLDSRSSSSFSACKPASLPAAAAPRMIIARDPFGIKPLYYADDGKTIRVASQVKALLAGGKVNTSPEPAGHVGFFLWGHVPEPYTLYKGIRSLPAGSYMVVNDASASVLSPFTFHVYQSISQLFAEAEKNAITLSKEEIHDRLRNALLDTVKHHLIADVPVGVFLSAGLDSGTLVGLASELSKAQLHTATLAFNEYVDTHDDESALSTLVADHYHTRHDTVWVSKTDFQEETHQLLDAMDQPTTDGVNSYFVSKAAVKSGLKVALSGLGGDELFGSYPSFKDIPRMVKLFGPAGNVPFLGKALRVISSPILKHLTSPKYAGLLEYGGSYGGAYLLRRGMFMPWELPDLLDGEMVKEGWAELGTLAQLDERAAGIRGDYMKVSVLELTWYMRNQLLRDTDWASMAHSLEVRVPLVDVNLLQTLSPLLTAIGRPSKQAFALTPLNPIPPVILTRGKTGFTVPVREWMLGVQDSRGERGLRGWAKSVYSEFTGCDSVPGYNAAQKSSSKISGTDKRQVSLKDASYAQKDIRILTLVTDAFGGHGGIAKFNRDLLNALCSYPGCDEVVAIPRLMQAAPEELPQNLRFITRGLNSKIKYISAVREALADKGKFDLIICGHINLLPLAYYCRKRINAPLGLVIHGIDAWQPTKSLIVNRLVSRLDYFISVSEFTKQKFLEWTSLDPAKGYILPNCVDMSRFGLGPKNPELLKRYGVKGKKIIMTLGRLVSHERYKGFDEVLELMPELSREIPEIAYLIVGDGNDQSRLQEKAETLKIDERVIFAGRIPEAEKADHYRLADAYVMPSRGEGFGIVFLEAMACGIPCIGSTADGSREALLNGRLGRLVDPCDRQDLKVAILYALRQSQKKIVVGLEDLSLGRYIERVHGILHSILGTTEQ